MKELRIEKYGVGTIHQNNKGENFKIIGKCKNSYRRIIQFHEHPMQYIKEVETNSILAGTCRNPYYPSIFGVGYLGEKYNSSHPLYRTWFKMMERCYNINNNRYHCYGAIGVRVHKDWHNFSTFVDDVLYGYIDGSEIIEQYRKLELSVRSINLDKDLKAIEKTAEGKGLLYSKDTVCIISASDNLKEMHERINGTKKLKKNK